MGIPGHAAARRRRARAARRRSSSSRSSCSAAAAARSRSGPQTVPGAPQAEDGLRDFSVYVFHDTQDFWASDPGYQHAKLVLYRGGVDTGCGSATSAVGPFYCPRDQRVYLDLSFYSDMTGQLGAQGRRLRLGLRDRA